MRSLSLVTCPNYYTTPKVIVIGSYASGALVTETRKVFKNHREENRHYCPYQMKSR